MLDGIIYIVITFALCLFGYFIINRDKTNIESVTKLKKEFNDKFKIMGLNIFINRQKTNNLERKNNMLLNSYRILYFRKIANLILDVILKNYASYLYKTEKIFIDNTKPKYKQNYFPIIIAKQKINNIEINTINLLIDYLMFVKDFSSSFIHLVEKNDVQIEILFSLFEKDKIKKEDDNYLISTSSLLNELFNIPNIENTGENQIIIKEKNEQNNSIDNIFKTDKSESNNSSENGTSTNEERNNNLKSFENNIEKEKNEIYNSFNLKKNKSNLEQKVAKKDTNIDKKELMIKIDNITDNLQKYYENENNNIKETIDQIQDLNMNVENILKKEKHLNENEIMKLKFIKYLNEINLNDISSKNDFNVLNGEFIFEKWKTTFNTNYKATYEFKSLVIYQTNIKLNELESTARKLMFEDEISIFCEEPGDFKNYKIDIIQKKEFNNYNKEEKLILSGK